MREDAKIASTCKHPDRACLDTGPLTLDTPASASFTASTFAGYSVYFHLELIDFLKEGKINLFDYKTV